MKTMRNYIGFFAAASLLLMTASCARSAEEDAIPAGEPGFGTLDLSSMVVSVEQNDTEALTRAVNTGPYMVSIKDHDAPEHIFTPCTLQSITGPITLPAGRYTVTVTSPEVTLPEWILPTYSGSADFSISRDVETPVTVTCTQSNLRVTVRFAEGIRSQIDWSQTVRIKVTVNGGSLDFINGDTSSGYFAVSDDAADNTMTVEFDALMNGDSTRTTSSSIVEGVVAGQWQRIYLTMDADSEFPVIITKGSEAGQIGHGTTWF